MQEYHLDVLNRTRMGQYLTSVEGSFIDECLQQNPNVNSILDVGGGTGRFAIPLAERGFKVTVIEVQSSPLWRLKAKSPSMDALLISSQARIWPIRDASVDCVLAIQIPGLPARWFWHECHRVLKPRGLVIICSANSHSYKGLFHKVRPLLKPFVSHKGEWAYTNYYRLSARKLVRIFEEEQFQLESALGYNWLPCTRGSDLSLIPFFGSLEGRVGLRNLAFQSPWVLFQARVR